VTDFVRDGVLIAGQLDAMMGMEGFSPSTTREILECDIGDWSFPLLTDSVLQGENGTESITSPREDHWG
jgi:hypothetical protein